MWVAWARQSWLISVQASRLLSRLSFMACASVAETSSGSCGKFLK